MVANTTHTGTHPLKALPTQLTVCRVVAIPGLIAGAVQALTPMQPCTVCTAWYLGGSWAAPASCALFVAAALTDYLDGFLARKLVRPSHAVLYRYLSAPTTHHTPQRPQNATSAFGAFLDPVADKLMVATVLILLSSQPVAAGTLAGNTWLLPIATIGTCFEYKWRHRHVKR